MMVGGNMQCGLGVLLLRFQGLFCSGLILWMICGMSSIYDLYNFEKPPEGGCSQFLSSYSA